MRLIEKRKHISNHFRTLKSGIYVAIAIFAFLSLQQPAHAQLAGTDTVIGDSCAGFPTGASRLTADGDGADAILICDGSVWRAPSVTVPLDPDPCIPAKHGSLRYNDSLKTLELCHDSDWISFIASGEEGDTPTAVSGDGYFVITNSTWTGNLAAAAGGDYTTAEANASQQIGDKLCLDDLTANDWMGKSDAQSRSILNSRHVRAFLCSRFSCNNALPSTTYYFAVSGELASGGASFTTDADGIGPNDGASWAGSTYFNGNKEFWSNRRTNSSTQWGDNSHGQSSPTRCEYSPGWTDIADAGPGNIGRTNTTNTDRWDAANVDCTVARYLVCMVHP